MLGIDSDDFFMLISIYKVILSYKLKLNAMIKNVIIGGMLIFLISCNSPEKKRFNYQQNFKPDSGSIKDQKARLEFG